MDRMPRDERLEASFALKRDPYGFLSTRARELGSDVFTARILLRETICMTGPDAARLFYDSRYFERAGAAPSALQKTLFGRGGVQGLDGSDQALRKQLFLSIVPPSQVAELGERMVRAWRRAAESWRERKRVELYGELQEVLTRAVCAWAGVPLSERSAARRTRQLGALFDQAGAFGLGHLYARFARAASERWLADLIVAVRAEYFAVREGTALRRIADHRTSDGRLLDPRVAAVELLNVLRPTVAVSLFLVFVAHALHEHPEAADTLRAGRAGDADRFIQEVRRFYPFFPAVPARVRRDFHWRGYAFRAGTRVLLDLYGINHDPRVWGDPEVFRPARFRAGDPGPWAFVPQGGGDVRTGHRCPGEGIAVELMRRGLHFLLYELDYTVPDQDLRIDRTRLPALPRSRFLITEACPAKVEPIDLERRRRLGRM